MNGVAAEIAQEVCMLLEHDDVNARARQQKSQHHPCRTSANDATTGLELCVHRLPGGVSNYIDVVRWTKSENFSARVVCSCFQSSPPYMSGGYLPAALWGLYTEI